MALALVLLTGAGLLLKSFVRLGNVNPGFNPRHVLTAELSLPKLRYPDKKAQVNFFTELERRVSNLPGVKNAGLTIILPMSGINSDSSFMIDGRVVDDAHPGPDEEIRLVSADYFRTLEIPLQRGRFFTKADNLEAPPVVIVNHALAERYWPNEDALGKRMQLPTREGPVWATIVGIVGDMHHRGLDQPVKPEFYAPLTQAPYPAVILAVRSTQDPTSLTSAIRREVQAIDPTLPIAHVRTLEQVIADSIAPRRLSVVAPHRLRRDRARPRLGRHLRRDVVPRRATDARDRRADGARCATLRCSSPDHCPRWSARSAPARFSA